MVYLWSLKWIQIKCLSVRSGSLYGCLRTNSFETATPMPHAAGRSARGGDRHDPNHTSWGALYVGLSELTSSIPIGVTDRAAAIAFPRPAEKLFVKSMWKIGGNCFLYCAASGKRHGNSKGVLRPCLLAAFLRQSLAPSLRPSLPLYPAPFVPAPLPPSVAPSLPPSVAPSQFPLLSSFLPPPPCVPAPLSLQQ